MHMEASWSKPMQFDALDAIVAREFDALAGRRSPSIRRAEPAHDGDPPADGFEAPAPDDEESFIERTVDYLRKRPDAGALLEAIRSHLDEDDAGEPLDEEAPSGSDDAAMPEGRT